jgi:hypothetical protein
MQLALAFRETLFYEGPSAPRRRFARIKRFARLSFGEP